jgi:hypothetical protein
MRFKIKIYRYLILRLRDYNYRTLLQKEFLNLYISNNRRKPTITARASQKSLLQSSTAT